MGAYKQLLASDIIVSPLEVNKGFTFYSAAQFTGSNVSIDRFLGTNLTTSLFEPNSEPITGQTTTQYQRLIYNSIKELYYSNYTNQNVYGDPSNGPSLVPGADEEGNRLLPSGSFPAYYNYPQTTLNYQVFYPTESNVKTGVISIPSKLFGDYIKPGSFKFKCESGSFYDDGEGNILTGSEYVGNIYYPHGIITLTGNSNIYDPTFASLLGSSSFYNTASYLSQSATPGTVYLYGNVALLNWTSIILNAITSSNVTCSFSSSYTIYETQYKCTIRENEFNYTLNPSVITGSNNTSSLAGQVYDYVTKPDFSPYITTVGLYDEAQNLLAVGKLSQPIPSSPTTDTTILINIDR